MWKGHESDGLIIRQRAAYDCSPVTWLCTRMPFEIMFWSGLFVIFGSVTALAVHFGPWPYAIAYIVVAVLAYVLGVLRGIRMIREEERQRKCSK